MSLSVCACPRVQEARARRRAGWWDETPLQRGVDVNWFWLGAKSFQTRLLQDRALHKSTRHVMFCDFSPVNGQKMQVSLPLSLHF